jgi:hypothetical protein
VGKVEVDLNPLTATPITELLKLPVILTVLLERAVHAPMKLMKLPQRRVPSWK